MTLVTPEGERITELTPAERAYLLALLDKCGSRMQLYLQYGVDRTWMRQSRYMPEPLFALGHWQMYDMGEVVIAYELTRKRRTNKPWTLKELNTAVEMQDNGKSFKAIGLAIGRSSRAVQCRLKQWRRDNRKMGMAA